MSTLTIIIILLYICLVINWHFHPRLDYDAKNKQLILWYYPHKHSKQREFKILLTFNK